MRPPKRWRKRTGNWRERPAERMGSDTWATAEATRRQVEKIPTRGAKGRIFFTKFGKNCGVDGGGERERERETVSYLL